MRETSGPPQVCAGGGDLVDFVDIDDAVLGQFQVVAGGVYQVPDQVFHVAAHVAGFAEFGGIPLDERDPDLLGNELDQVGLAHAGGADEDDVVLDGAHPGFRVPPQFQGMADAVEMGADLGGQDTLGQILLDDVLVQIGFQLFRLQVEIDLAEVGALWP